MSRRKLSKSALEKELDVTGAQTEAETETLFASDDSGSEDEDMLETELFDDSDNEKEYFPDPADSSDEEYTTPPKRTRVRNIITDLYGIEETNVEQADVPVLPRFYPMKRCSTCTRTEDKKTKYRCCLCQKPVFTNHFHPVCLTCHEGSNILSPSKIMFWINLKNILLDIYTIFGNTPKRCVMLTHFCIQYTCGHASK
ncbi:hypothetical protein Avbf_06145 [Armadillidium vulgare]|nr:hypothetical protein Avbf_06145 [Armadillidium vulgare]